MCGNERKLVPLVVGGAGTPYMAYMAHTGTPYMAYMAHTGTPYMVYMAHTAHRKA